MARTSSGGGTNGPQNAHDEWKKLAANEGAANVSRVTSRDVPTCLEASNKKQRVEQMSCEDTRAWETHVSRRSARRARR